jgi:oligoribonuclease NrnB/cAMP/cGMP phosphodiesterase (DHH superfamily)
VQTPDICVFHGFCPDGFTSAWAVWKKFGDAVEYRHGSYGSPPPTVDGKHVLLVDFSYKRPVLDEMLLKAASITIFDHHVTSQADLQPLLDSGKVGGLFDMNRSGCGLTWDILHPNILRPRIIDFVEDRDLWRWKFGDLTKFACLWLDSFEMKFDQWDAASAQLESDPTEAYKIGSYLYKRHMKNCESMIAATLQRVNIAGFDVPCCNVSHLYCSEVGNILAKRDDAPFSATFFINKDGDTVYSLRSIDSKEDVSAIALKWGGGGHRNAAGFRLKPGETL